MKTDKHTELLLATQNRVIDFLKLLALLSGGGALLMASALISYISSSPTNTLLISFLMIGVYLFSGTTAICVLAIAVRISAEINRLAASNINIVKAWKINCRFATGMFLVSVSGMFILFYVYCDNVIREIKETHQLHAIQKQNPKDDEGHPNQKQP